MKYNVEIVTELGWLRRFKTNNNQDFLDYKKTAEERAAKCLPWNQYDKELKHLVYYYEIEEDNEIKVNIYMNPELVDDKLFYDFVDIWKPLYVGAIHRRD